MSPLRRAINSLFFGDGDADPQSTAATHADGGAIEVHQPEPIPTASVMNPLESQRAAQEDVTRRLGELVRQLDGTLGALPEMARQQVRLVDTLVDQASRAKDRDAALARGLKDLGEGADRQTQVLGLVQQQLDLHYETSRRVADILGEARTALGAFAATSERHARSVEALADATRRRTIQSDRLERRLQFWLVVTTALSTTALVYSLVVALRDAPQSQPVVSAPEQPKDSPAAEPAVVTSPAATAQAPITATPKQPTVESDTAVKPSSPAPQEPATQKASPTQKDPVAPGAVRGTWAEPFAP